MNQTKTDKHITLGGNSLCHNINNPGDLKSSGVISFYSLQDSYDWHDQLKQQRKIKANKRVAAGVPVSVRLEQQIKAIPGITKLEQRQLAVLMGWVMRGSDGPKQAKELKRVFGNGYTRIITLAERYLGLQISGSYRVGVKSKTFIWTNRNDYKSDPIVYVKPTRRAGNYCRKLSTIENQTDRYIEDNDDVRFEMDCLLKLGKHNFKPSTMRDWFVGKWGRHYSWFSTIKKSERSKLCVPGYNNVKLLEVDLSAFNLRNSWDLIKANNSDALLRYKQLCCVDTDPYQTMADDIGCTKAEMKDDTNKFFCRLGNQQLHATNNKFYQYLNNNNMKSIIEAFVRLSEREHGAQWKLYQKKERQYRKYVVSEVKKRGVEFIVSNHDGFFVHPKDRDVLCDVVEQALFLISSISTKAYKVIDHNDHNDLDKGVKGSERAQHTPLYVSHFSQPVTSSVNINNNKNKPPDDWVIDDQSIKDFERQEHENVMNKIMELED